MSIWLRIVTESSSTGRDGNSELSNLSREHFQTHIMKKGTDMSKGKAKNKDPEHGYDANDEDDGIFE
jgi:hypothetical protein